MDAQKKLRKNELTAYLELTAYFESKTKKFQKKYTANDLHVEKNRDSEATGILSKRYVLVSPWSLPLLIKVS